MPANKTKKNHFVPCFYTRRWASGDGKLCQFSRPYKAVVPKRVFPEGTGYSEDLYTENALPPATKTYLEDVFLKRVDQQASDVHKILLQGGLNTLTIGQRNSWVRFMMSMMQRSPDKITSLRRRWTEQYQNIDSDLEDRYQSERTQDQPATLAEFLNNASDDFKARGTMRLLQTVMDLPRVGTHILNMRWAVLESRSSKRTFLTSDRPVIKTNGLERADGHIGLPLSPDKLFMCANTNDTLTSMANSPAENLIVEANKIVTGQAERFVYGTDDSALRFVEKHFRPNC